MGKYILVTFFANNFGDFWNNSTNFGEILDMNEILFPNKF